MTSLEFVPNPNHGSSGETRRTLRRWRRLDGRIRAAKAIKRLTAQYRRALGRVASKPYWAARIAEVAEYQVLVEEMRGALLRGQHVDILALNRLTNTLRRLRDSLGLDGAPPRHLQNQRLPTSFAATASSIGGQADDEGARQSLC